MRGQGQPAQFAGPFLFYFLLALLHRETDKSELSVAKFGSSAVFLTHPPHYGNQALCASLKLAVKIKGHQRTLFPPAARFLSQWRNQGKEGRSTLTLTLSKRPAPLREAPTKQAVQEWEGCFPSQPCVFGSVCTH